MTLEQRLAATREWGTSVLTVSLWAKVAACLVLITHASFDDFMARLVAVGACLTVVGCAQTWLAIRTEYLSRKIARRENSYD